jgi:hypothetical protein
MLFFLKLFLAPALVGAITLGARRWGPRIGGALTGLPVIAGPTLCFYAIEQGPDFGAKAAGATLVGLIGLSSFSVVYAHCSTRTNWPLSLLAGWIAASLTTFALYWAPLNLAASLALAVASFSVARLLLPGRPLVLISGGNPVLDLVLRMIAALALVLTLTTLASRLGPALSGYLTPFPIAAAIISVFTHNQHGPGAVVMYLQGFLLALNCFAVFCFVLAISFQPLGIPLAMAAALSAQLLVHSILLYVMTRRR